MDLFKRAYRDPKSPLTPLLPLDKNTAFNFDFDDGSDVVQLSTPTLKVPPLHSSLMKRRSPLAHKMQFQKVSSVLPKPLSPRVARLLDQAHLQNYKGLFEVEEIDFDVLLSLTLQELQSIGVVNKQDCLTIIEMIKSPTMAARTHQL